GRHRRPNPGTASARSPRHPAYDLAGGRRQAGGHRRRRPRAAGDADGHAGIAVGGRAPGDPDGSDAAPPRYAACRVPGSAERAGARRSRKRLARGPCRRMSIRAIPGRRSTLVAYPNAASHPMIVVLAVMLLPLLTSAILALL